MHNRPAMLAKFVGYALTGGTAAIVDLGGFALLVAVGLPVTFAAIVSWLIAALVNYHLTSRFVFMRTPTGRHGLVFLVAAAVGLSVNVGVTTLSAEVLGLAPVLAKLIGIGVAFMFNFLLNVLIVFRD